MTTTFKQAAAEMNYALDNDLDWVDNERLAGFVATCMGHVHSRDAVLHNLTSADTKRAARLATAVQHVADTATDNMVISQATCCMAVYYLALGERVRALRTVNKAADTHRDNSLAEYLSLMLRRTQLPADEITHYLHNACDKMGVKK